MATVDDLFSLYSPEVRAIAEAARNVVREELSDQPESVKMGWKVLVFGPGMRTALCSIQPHTNHVNLGFGRGVDLPDPEGLLEGTGKSIRHVKLRSVDDADRPAVRALLREARKLA